MRTADLSKVASDEFVSKIVTGALGVIAFLFLWMIALFLGSFLF